MRNGREVVVVSSMILCGAVGSFAGNALANNDEIPRKIDTEAIINASAQVGIGMLATQAEGSCEQIALHEWIMQDPNTGFPRSVDEMSANLELVCADSPADKTVAAELAFPYFEQDKKLRTELGHAIANNNKKEKETNLAVPLLFGVLGTLTGAVGASIVTRRKARETPRPDYYGQL